MAETRSTALVFADPDGIDTEEEDSLHPTYGGASYSVPSHFMGNLNLANDSGFVRVVIHK